MRRTYKRGIRRIYMPCIGSEKDTTPNDSMPVSICHAYTINSNIGDTIVAYYIQNAINHSLFLFTV